MVMRTTKYLVVLLIIIIGLQYSLSLQLPFETAAVGRVQGDSLDDLEKALDVSSVNVSGAQYYTDAYVSPLSGALGNEEGKTLDALQKAYKANNVSYNNSWTFGKVVSKEVASDKMLIVQADGEVKDDGKIYAGDSTNDAEVGTPLSGIQLGDAVQGNNLVITDVGMAGIYLPSMGKNDSFSSQLAGKAGALIASNGEKNPELVKSIICSLALEEKMFGKNDYYRFSTLGDRFRNARNNIQEFGSGSGAATAGDYSLYGSPFIKVNGLKVSAEQLESVCGNYAEYSVFPSQQQVSAADPQQYSLATETSGSVAQQTFTKNVELDFSEYLIKQENGFELIDLNGAMQENSYSMPVLPFAVTEIQFPLGTIVSDANIASMLDPITLDLNMVPSFGGEGFVGRVCGENVKSAGAEFSQVYTEDKEIIAAKINPVEIVDCNAGIFRLYRNIALKIDYSPYSPVLIKGTEAAKELLPLENLDVNVLIENITPDAVSGTLKITDGNTVKAEKNISLAASESRKEVLSFPAENVEGFYDYSIEFEQGGETKTVSNFKAKVEVLKIGLSFEGSKRIYEKFGNGFYAGVFDVETFNQATHSNSSMEISDYGGGARYRLYTKASNDMGTPVRADVIISMTSKAENRFSIDDLPLVFKTGESYIKSRKNQPRGSENWEEQGFDFGGNYYFEKENENSIMWKRGESGLWNHINVTDWNKEGLGFDLRLSSSSQFTLANVGLPNRVFATNGRASLALTDKGKYDDAGTHFSQIFREATELGSQDDPDGFFDSETVFTAFEISWPYENSARGTAFVNANFENMGGQELPVQAKYLLMDEEGKAVGEGEFSATVPQGGMDRQIMLEGFSDYNKNYDLVLETSYENRSKVSSASFSGNIAPNIIAPSYIFADAYDLVKLDFSASDPDGDRLTVNASEPFSAGNEWQTTEADEGIHAVAITASDGIETVSKEITIEIGPPKIKCSFNYECGSLVTVEQRACSGNSDCTSGDG